MPNILLVEDDTALSELIASYLERNGYQVSVISRGDQVRERAKACLLYTSPSPRD